VIIEAIKLVEGGLAELCDEVWLVTCEPASQLERLVRRGSDAADASRRISTQGDLVERLRPAATWVVDTSGTPDETRRLVSERLESAISRTA
jgi:Dephospho-CoA kinase